MSKLDILLDPETWDDDSYGAVVRCPVDMDFLNDAHAELAALRKLCEAVEVEHVKPVIHTTDIEAAVKEWGDWTDSLTAVLRKHTKPISYKELVQAMAVWILNSSRIQNVPSDEMLEECAKAVTNLLNMSTPPVANIRDILEEEDATVRRVLEAQTAQSIDYGNAFAQAINEGLVKNVNAEEYLDHPTLRDQFAMHAKDQISNKATPDRISKSTGLTPPEFYDDCMGWSIFWTKAEAILRYRYADAMIEARKTKNQRQQQ